MRRCDRARDGGMVTAETALAIPVLVAMVGMLLWGLGAVAVQLQCLDAARAGARAAARGEADGVVAEVTQAAAPRGAEVAWERDGGLYRVRVAARTLGPRLLALRVEGEAVAHAEGERVR